MNDHKLPSWALEIISLYESGVAAQFILHGNVDDRFMLSIGNEPALGDMIDFWKKILTPQFDVVIIYDVGNGIRLEKGKDLFSQWGTTRNISELPKTPRLAIEYLTQYLRFTVNWRRLGNPQINVACLVKNAELLVPAAQGMNSNEVNALVMLLREWTSDDLVGGRTIVSCLVTENLNDLHPLLVNNPKAAQIVIPMPTPQDLEEFLQTTKNDYAEVIPEFTSNLGEIARHLTGSSLSSVESTLKLRRYHKQKLSGNDLVDIKKRIVERDCHGLIEIIESTKSLQDIHGQEPIRQRFKQDITLWNKGDLMALPMGYLICGPVGTGKTFLVECIAGEAGVPMIKILNFRDKWVGSTEGNLERIFRTLHSIGRCFVFIDEADQALGRRDSGSGDSGVSGRVYSMMAKELSQACNRGRVIWIFASSRPDLIEVDLKRPGRIDVRIPVLPSSSTKEGFDLLKSLLKRLSISLNGSEFKECESMIPEWLTAGAAEALAIKIYRCVKTTGMSESAALAQIMGNYQPPIPKETMEQQLRLSLSEASDTEFVHPIFRRFLSH